MSAVKMIRLKLQWHIGLAEGTPEIGDTGPHRYAAENDLPDNYKSKDLRIMRGNGTRGAMEKTVLDSTLTGVESFPNNSASYFPSVASLSGSLHTSY